MATKKKMTILCVDDEPEILNSLFDTLSDDYTILTAPNGKEALKIFLEEDVSLIITDQRMPLMTGSELLAKIQSIAPHCKKILMTGYSDINAAVDAINRGAVNKYLSKPWDDNELVSIIEDLLFDVATDRFIARMTRADMPSKSIIEEQGEYDETTDHYGSFLETFENGVCLVDGKGEIEHVNKKGLELLKGEILENLQGEPYADYFLMDDARRESFKLKYKNRDWTAQDLEVRLCNGTTVTMQVNVTFAERGSDRIVGFFFDTK